MRPTNPIFRVFGQSPISPLQEHMEKVKNCARLLMAFIAAVLDHNWQKAEEIQKDIILLENEADDIKNNLRAHLPKSLFLPFSRGDLLEMLKMQDRLANIVKDIAGLIIGRKMHIPESIAMVYVDLLKRCLDSVEKAFQAVSELDELLETGFRGAEIDIIEAMIQDLHSIERETDDLQVKVRQKLFAIEKELLPIDVIFLYKVIQWTGDIADIAEQVGNRLQLLLAR